MATGLLAPPGLAPLSGGQLVGGGEKLAPGKWVYLQALGGDISLSVLTSDAYVQVVRPACPHLHSYKGCRPR